MEEEAKQAIAEGFLETLDLFNQGLLDKLSDDYNFYWSVQDGHRSRPSTFIIIVGTSHHIGKGRPFNRKVSSRDLRLIKSHLYPHQSDERYFSQKWPNY